MMWRIGFGVGDGKRQGDQLGNDCNCLDEGR